MRKGSCEWLLTVSPKWQMNNERACIIPHQCLNFPQRHYTVDPFTFVCIHTVHTVCACLHACVWMCIHLIQGDSLIPVMAGIGEGLQLDGRLWDFASSLGLDDSPIDVLLQVDEAAVVAQRQPGRDVVVLIEIRLPDSVSTHDVVHVHADSVSDFGRQGRGGGRPGMTLPGWVLIFGKLEDDTLKDRLHHHTL